MFIENNSKITVEEYVLFVGEKSVKWNNRKRNESEKALTELQLTTKNEGKYTEFWLARRSKEIS